MPCLLPQGGCGGPGGGSAPDCPCAPRNKFPFFLPLLALSPVMCLALLSPPLGVTPSLPGVHHPANTPQARGAP